MKPMVLMIEKDYKNHVSPYKPKPLSSCWYGDKMVDMYARFSFEEHKVDWSKIYTGHSHFDYDEFFSQFPVVDEDEMEELEISKKAHHDFLYLH